MSNDIAQYVVGSQKSVAKQIANELALVYCDPRHLSNRLFPFFPEVIGKPSPDDNHEGGGNAVSNNGTRNACQTRGIGHRENDSLVPHYPIRLRNLDESKFLLLITASKKWHLSVEFPAVRTL